MGGAQSDGVLRRPGIVQGSQRAGRSKHRHGGSKHVCDSSVYYTLLRIRFGADVSVHSQMFLISICTMSIALKTRWLHDSQHPVGVHALVRLLPRAIDRSHSPVLWSTPSRLLSPYLSTHRSVSCFLLVRSLVHSISHSCAPPPSFLGQLPMLPPDLWTIHSIV